MNDFDFEELDKAVNSLADKTREENNLPASSRPEPITVTPADRRQTPAAAVQVKQDAPAPSPRAPREPAPVQQPPTPPTVQHAKRLSTVQPKRRGAFMDIMAPSKAPTRHGATTIQPLSSPESVTPEPVKPEQPKPAEASPAPQPLGEPAKPTPEKPAAPIDMADHASELMAENREPQPESQTPPAPEPAKPAVSAGDDETKWPDPLDFHDDFSTDKKETESKPEPAASPFLPEAKVEKRPLGAFSTFAPTEKPAEPSKPAVAEPEAPELLPSDELSPEADGTFKEPETPKAPTMHEASAADKKQGEEKQNESATPDMHERAMMSIPKQYHTESKPADTAKRPVFDTKEYHPPLLEAASHEHRGGGSMWSKLFIALVVLVLLGVAAYFAYIYFVQQ